MPGSKTSIVVLIACAYWLGAVPAMAEPPPAGTPLSFVSCPIARDTGPDTDLCFFAEYEGARYALVNQPDWGNMQLKHKVLVEATVMDGPPVCGATPPQLLAMVSLTNLAMTPPKSTRVLAVYVAEPLA